MSLSPDGIANCTECQSPMDVDVFPPFTMVNCPTCSKENRVKCEIGQYLLTGRKGMGGMSIVFSATDRGLDREVAVKILNEQFSSDTIRISQFEQEAKITARISHPNVVRVYTVGQAFGRYYIAMEMVSGKSLEDILAQQNSIAENELIPHMEQVVEGLQAAYKENLIHRDMKPGNILIDSFNKAKIVDFGLALVTQGGEATAEEIWATPYYVPPETLDGKPEDFRSDIYALCATIYHCLSGEPPFEVKERNAHVLEAAKKTIPPLKERSPHLSPAICQVIDKGMSFDRENRFSSYNELLAAIQFAEDNIGVPDAVLPTQLIQENGSNSKAPKALGILIPSLIGLLVIVAGTYFIIQAVSNTQEITTDPNANTPRESSQPVEIDEALQQKIHEGYNLILTNIEEQKFSEALTLSKDLMQLEKHPEPSATIAGLHGIVISQLSGDDTHFTTISEALNEHIASKSYPRSFGFTKNKLSQNLQKLTTKDHENIDTISITGNKEVALTLKFAIALQQLSEGNFKVAENHFKQLERVHYPQTIRSSKIIDHYKEITSLFLDDISGLKEFREIKTIVSEEELRKYISEIQALNFKTKTPVFKKTKKKLSTLAELKLKKIIKDAKAREQAKNITPPLITPPVPPSTFDEFFKRNTAAIDSYQYPKVLEIIQECEFEEPEDIRKKNAYLYLLQKAIAYRVDFVTYFTDIEEGTTITHLTEKEFKIVQFLENGVEVKKPNKKTELLPWENIQPNSLLQLHPKLVSGMEANQSTATLENAACFAFLSREYELSNNAANAFIKKDPNFKVKWDFIQGNFNPSPFDIE